MVAKNKKIRFYTYLTQIRDVKERGLHVLAKIFLMIVLSHALTKLIIFVAF